MGLTLGRFRELTKDLPDDMVLGFDDEYDLASVKHIESIIIERALIDNSWEFCLEQDRNEPADFDAIVFSREEPHRMKKRLG